MENIISINGTQEIFIKYLIAQLIMMITIIIAVKEISFNKRKSKRNQRIKIYNQFLDEYLVIMSTINAAMRYAKLYEENKMEVFEKEDFQADCFEMIKDELAEVSDSLTRIYILAKKTMIIERYNQKFDDEIRNINDDIYDVISNYKLKYNSNDQEISKLLDESYIKVQELDQKFRKQCSLKY